MAYKLEVTGENLAEFANNFRQIIGAFIPVLQHGQPPVPPAGGQPVSPNGDNPAVSANGDNPVTNNEEPKSEGDVPAKSKRNAKKADEPKQTDEETKPKITIEDVREKLKELGAKKDHAAVFDLLKPYGVRKASEIPAEKYAEVISKVNEALGG